MFGACRRCFPCLKKDMFISEMAVSLSVIVNVSCFNLFSKHQVDSKRKDIKKMQWDFGLSSHLDPIGDQIDVQYLSIVVDTYIYIYIYLAYLLLYLFGKNVC